MKEEFLIKWSNWWSLTRDAKQLNEAFARELNELIERELALTQQFVVGQSGKYYCGSCNSEIDNINKELGLCDECGYELAR